MRPGACVAREYPPEGWTCAYVARAAGAVWEDPDPLPEPGRDDCPVGLPTLETACTTAPELSCAYETPRGCGYTFGCQGCVWRQTTWDADPTCSTCAGRGCEGDLVCTECDCAAESDRWQCLPTEATCGPCS